MCNLRYVDKIVDKAIVCHLIPNSSCGVLMQYLLKQQKKTSEDKSYPYYKRNAQ